ncbi:MAG: sugar kinase [Planctomycetota bacterium]|jgi:2-dehydro-3-deoxygluconokinase|nr:sugar kinase [Planctomycetota bacterium]
MGISYRKAGECAYDAVSLGEVMLRLDPGEGRIHTARSFRAWEGGGEYNVCRGLRRCFGLRAGVVTSLADNPVGRLVEDFILQGGVDASRIIWVPYDGIGKKARNGLNFTERGFGVRGAVGCSDRGHTAASQMTPESVDWDELFGKAGVRHFHTGGIFAALGDRTPDTVIAALKAAKRHGTVTSYDLNYRPSLWKGIGGKERAREVNRELAKYVDVMIGNEEDFTACLGLEIEGVDESLSRLPIDSFKKMITAAVEAYPNFQAVATTLRKVRSAGVNDWGAVCWHQGRFHEAKMREGLEILDRVGGGDSFASGFIYGLMTFGDAAKAVEYGAAHGALAMTTPGDTTMATLAEVEKLVGGGGARVDR